MFDTRCLMFAILANFYRFGAIIVGRGKNDRRSVYHLFPGHVAQGYLNQAVAKFFKNFAVKLTGLHIPLNQLQGV
jgi:hypothetical protein